MVSSKTRGTQQRGQKINTPAPTQAHVTPFGFVSVRVLTFVDSQLGQKERTTGLREFRLIQFIISVCFWYTSTTGVAGWAWAGRGASVGGADCLLSVLRLLLEATEISSSVTAEGGLYEAIFVVLMVLSC